MDGHAILAQWPDKHLKPWDDCIPTSRLSRDNLPPFYVRLRDDQIEYLSRWARENRKNFPLVNLGIFWPADFNRGGHICGTRNSWGAAFADEDLNEREKTLVGSNRALIYDDPGLRPTYTSSGKFMRKETGLSRASSTAKRGASESSENEADRDPKRARVDSEKPPFGKAGGSSTSNDKNLQESEQSRDEVREILINKVDTLVNEKGEMEAQIEQLEEEVSHASESAAEDKEIIKDHEETIKDHGETIETHEETIKDHEEIIKDHEETIDRRAQEIVALKESIVEGERCYKRTENLYHSRYLTMQAECKAHEKTVAQLRKERESRKNRSAQLGRLKKEIEAHAKDLTELGNQ